MSRPADESKIIQQFRFTGRSTGAVKTLAGFKKSHHTVPDAVNSATSAFLTKLAADALSEEGEKMFQQARSLLQYKRKDLSLDVSNGVALLSARDFVFEVAYSLCGDNPAEYVVSRSLYQIKRPDFLLLTECDQLFARLFSEVVFVLQKGAPVEKVIDAIEGLEPAETPLRVTYPSDYEQCVISVAGVEAEVRFNGGELAIVFPRTGTPRELWESFLAVRSAFDLSEDKTLAGLVAR